MRVSPCAWYDNEREWVLEKARQSAECTHNHSEGIKGAICVADCIYHARQGMSKSKIKTLVEINYGYNLNQTCDEIRVTNSFDETCQVTVPQAIVCFLESNSFEHAVRLAVSIGGDSDTIAAITGGIAEAYHGIPVNIALNALQYLPQEFVSVLNNFNENMKISTPHKEIV
jgi:ADP-ribosylglycohydrolase